MHYASVCVANKTYTQIKIEFSTRKFMKYRKKNTFNIHNDPAVSSRHCTPFHTSVITHSTVTDSYK